MIKILEYKMSYQTHNYEITVTYIILYFISQTLLKYCHSSLELGFSYGRKWDQLKIWVLIPYYYITFLVNPLQLLYTLLSCEFFVLLRVSIRVIMLMYIIQNLMNNVYIFGITLALVAQFQMYRNYDFISMIGTTSSYLLDI